MSINSLNQTVHDHLETATTLVGFVQDIAVIDIIQDADETLFDELDLRPPRHVEETDSDLRDRHVGEFSTEQIRRHVRHARETVFGAFESGRAANVTYPDSRFDEFQALMALAGCGTPQDQSRMETFFGEDYTPTVILTSGPSNIHAGDDSGRIRSIENLLDTVTHLQILQPPVTVAIDITTWPYHAEDDLPSEVRSIEETGEIAYKFATLSLVDKNMPIVLAIERRPTNSTYSAKIPNCGRVHPNMMR